MIELNFKHPSVSRLRRIMFGLDLESSARSRMIDCGAVFTFSDMHVTEILI